MATINQLGSNKMEMGLASGGTLFYSYNTPVAFRHPTGQFFRTDTRHSVTTSKHINWWLKERGATIPVGVMTQDELSGMA